MIDLLVDTNVLIYFRGGHPTYLDFFGMIAEKSLGISVITFMEMLMGISDGPETAAMVQFLSSFEVVAVDMEIARETALWMRGKKLRSLRHSSLADAIIGQTALQLGVPLVTNNPKDFASLKGLEILVPA